MTATLTAPRRTAEKHVVITHSPAQIDHSPMEISEEHRWYRLLLPPLVLGSAAFAAAVGTGQQWLIGVALFLGPMTIILGFIYLGLTSDSNGE